MPQKKGNITLSEEFRQRITKDIGEEVREVIREEFTRRNRTSVSLVLLLGIIAGIAANALTTSSIAKELINLII